MLRYFFLILLFSLIACDEYNSNSADKIKYSEDVQEEVAEPGDANFAPAFAVITTRCISCHSNHHNNWASFTDNEKWISSGVVHRGDPDNSEFIKRIINTGGPGANMPEGLGALPDVEYQLLRKWITEMP
jgi:uncharacterized membrane protein